MQVIESDLFQSVRGRFDLIIFDPPFRWFKPRDIQQRATGDENYATLTKFFQQVRSHLRPSGRILMFFGTSGDIKYLRHLINQAGLRRGVMASKELVKDGWKVKYFTYQLCCALSPALFQSAQSFRSAPQRGNHIRAPME